MQLPQLGCCVYLLLFADGGTSGHQRSHGADNQTVFELLCIKGRSEEGHLAIVAQVRSYLLTANGDVEQSQNQQSNEVMADHSHLAIYTVSIAL